MDNSPNSFNIIYTDINLIVNFYRFNKEIIILVRLNKYIF